MTCIVQIRISQEDKDRLRKRKVHERQGYNEIIKELLDKVELEEYKNAKLH